MYKATLNLLLFSLSGPNYGTAFLITPEEEPAQVSLKLSGREHSGHWYIIRNKQNYVKAGRCAAEKEGWTVKPSIPQNVLL